MNIYSSPEANKTKTMKMATKITRKKRKKKKRKKNRVASTEKDKNRRNIKKYQRQMMSPSIEVMYSVQPWL